jgi:hypothetical protein
MKGFKNSLDGELRWVITLMFTAGFLKLPTNIDFHIHFA